MFWEVLHDRAILLRLKEPLARILDVQHLDFGACPDFSRTTPEPERPSQYRQFVVHGRRLRALLEPLGLIGRIRSEVMTLALAQGSKNSFR